VLLLVALDLLSAGRGLNPTVDIALYSTETETGAAIGAAIGSAQGRLYYTAEAREQLLFDRYLDFQDYRSDLRGAERLAYWSGFREALLPDLPVVERLPSANTFEPLVQARYRRLLQALDQADPQVTQRTLGLMNVAYLFDPNPPSTASIVHRSTAVTVYRNPALRPRVYVAHRALLAHSPEHALDLLLSPTFAPSTVILENPELALGLTSPQFPDSPIAQLPNPPNQATIQLTLEQPGYLVLMDAFYPGWRATVDGQVVEIERANYAFRALALEAGEHEVVFTYRPRSLIAGTIVSSAALIALLLALAVLVWGKEKH
jgi:hypothetical protein